MALGHNGFLAIVPGTEYAAVSVHASWTGHEGLEPGTWMYTDIAHIGDDPLWEMLPEDGEDGPDNRKINTVHRAPFRSVQALTREAGRHISEPIAEACSAQNRIALRRAMKTLPDWKSISLQDGSMGCVRESGSAAYRIPAG